MALSSSAPLSRAGRADTQTVWEPYRSCTDTLPLVPHYLERVGQTHKRCGNRTDLAPTPSPSITIVARKRKFVKKNGRSSVVLRTLPVLQDILSPDIYISDEFHNVGIS